MNIIVNAELQAYIDPLTPDEHEALERSILAEGCRDALVLWGEVLVDGHNRHGICQKHGLPFQTVQHPSFKSMEDVHLWMIDQHLGRRSVSDFQRGVLALRKREILAERQSRKAAPAAGDDGQASADTQAPWGDDADGRGPATVPLKSRADIARAARLSNSQVVMIEKIQKQAAPELVAAVKAGDISLNAAAAVASLPVDEQRSAALAGKDELKQAAKRVRGEKRKAPSPEASGEGAADDADSAEATLASKTGGHDPMQILKDRVIELTAENETLRKRVAELESQQSRADAA
jgi:hypothetical protein